MGIDGLWAGTSDGMGNKLELDLRSRDGKVTGTGRRERGALGAAVFNVTGTWKPPRLVLTLHIDERTLPVLELTATGAERLSGTLTWQGPSVQSMVFVRP